MLEKICNFMLMLVSSEVFLQLYVNFFLHRTCSVYHLAHAFFYLMYCLNVTCKFQCKCLVIIFSIVAML